MSWKQEGDRILLDISVHDWQNLLVALGQALSASFKVNDDSETEVKSLLRLINTLNEGNPNFTRARIPGE